MRVRLQLRGFAPQVAAVNGTIYVAKCPLLPVWTSDPVDSEEAAKEAGRTHLAGHTHGDLVDFAAQSIALERYHKEGTA